MTTLVREAGLVPEEKTAARAIQARRLLGRLEHNALPPYYHACDVFATASLSEMNSRRLPLRPCKRQQAGCKRKTPAAGWGNWPSMAGT